jgi:hypothetical protein
MKFAVIDPHRQTLERRTCHSYSAIRQEIFGSQDTDHGIVGNSDRNGGTGIVVEEFSLFRQDQAYFAIAQRLYAGIALVYGFNASGHTVSCEGPLEILWLPDKDAAEAAIAAGTVQRPQIVINGEVVWSWPDPHAIPGETNSTKGNSER